MNLDLNMVESSIIQSRQHVNILKILNIIIELDSRMTDLKQDEALSWIHVLVNVHHWQHYFVWRGYAFLLLSASAEV